jgi:hypothetical protein
MAIEIRTLRADENTAGNPPFPAAKQFKEVERSRIKGPPGPFFDPPLGG